MLTDSATHSLIPFLFDGTKKLEGRRNFLIEIFIITLSLFIIFYELQVMET